MKGRFSLVIVILLGVFLSIIRIYTPNDKSNGQIQVTTWDALGYYMYLPATYIYADETQLTWLPHIDSLYSVSGGEIYQANRQVNGHYVNKYLMGVSILQTPFFLIAHFLSARLGFPSDGFSLPYQLAIAWGCIFWVFISLFVLRRLLLHFFNDWVVSCTLILVVIGTNMIQYVAIEGGQSHGWIFPLYVFLMYITYSWYQKQTILKSFLLGLIVGLAMISRPTEAVMIMIPIFWISASLPTLKDKWQFFKSHPSYLLLIVVGGFLGILPQLLYWKRTTGHFIYDVGSKWDFFNPHFRVLFGWEKGWFIYTPLVVLFIIGLFFLKKYPFQKSIIIFCMLNIYIIIAWHIWRYGGSYSTRALVQSYPVLSFAMAGFLQWIYTRKWILYLFPLLGFLVYVNMFQIRQYNEGILHYDEMNWKYYSAIYLNENPTALDMSLLDIDEQMSKRERKKQSHFLLINESKKINPGQVFFSQVVTKSTVFTQGNWFNLKTIIKVQQGLWGSFLCVRLVGEQETKESKIRLYNVLCKEGRANDYEMDIELPANWQLKRIDFLVSGNAQFIGQLDRFVFTKNWNDGY